jgi:4-hydroxy-2-oxoheptanedioate aldolase
METGADFVVIDAQHGTFGMDHTLDLIRALSPISSKKAYQCIVRVTHVNDAEICKYLDAGADGLIAPMVNTATICDAFVKGALYPPQGVRSFGPYRQRLTSENFSLSNSNQSVMTLAMIETAEGYRNLDSILDTPNLGGVFIGPNDLAISMGVPHSASPKGTVLTAALDICKRAHAKGKIAGIFCLDPETAKQMVQSGFDFVSVTTDTYLLSHYGKLVIDFARNKE